MLTTPELQRRTGTSAKTLSRYARRNLIPPMQIQRHPTGRGRVGFWPAWIVDRLNEIRLMLSQGKSLDEIRDELGCNWEAEEQRRIRRRPDVRAAMQRLERDAAEDQVADIGTDTVYEFLRRLGIKRPGISKQLETALSNKELVNLVLQLLRQGSSPVVLFAGETIAAMPDFMVPFFLRTATNEPVLLLPVRDLFLGAFERAEPKLPKQVKYGPAALVVEHGEIRRFKRKGKWNFAIEK
jgi:DNA-binding transcriptional MerR regulator